MWVVELAWSDTKERLEGFPAHRRYLTDLHERSIVRMAGPLADNTGSVMVFDVATRDEVQRLLYAVPYHTTTGVTVASIREWSTFVC